MKQFESSEASLPTPSKLDFKTMKETTEDLSRDSHNNGQLRLSSPEKVEVQNGSKKLLEIVDFNSSKRVVCDSSLKKDTGRISGTSEKENVITNGLPYGSGSVQTAQSDETEERAHRTETVDLSSDLSGPESAQLGAEDLLDIPEDNIGNKSTLLVSGSGVSDEDQAKSVDDVSKLINGPLCSDSSVNSATDIKSAGNSKEQQLPINGELLGEGSGVGKGGKLVSSTDIQDQILDEQPSSALLSEEELSSLDEPPVLEPGATERLSEPEVEQTGGEAEALNCDSTASCRVEGQSSPAETLSSKLLEDVNLDSSSRGPLEDKDVVAQDMLLKTQKELSRDTNSLDGPVEAGDSLSEVGELHDGSTFGGELDSLEKPIEDEEADEPDSMQETLEEFSSHDEAVDGETHSLQEPNEDGVPKKDGEQDSLEGPLEEQGVCEESEAVNEPNLLQDPVEEDSESHSLADEACESDSLQGSTGKVPDSTKVCPPTELMDFEEHFSDSIEDAELEPSDEAMDTDELMDTKLDSPDEVECKSLGSLNEDLGMETLEQAEAEMNSCDSIAEAKEAVLADEKLENADPVVKSKEVSVPDELDDGTESEFTNLLSGKEQTSFSEDLLKNTKLQGCDDLGVKDPKSPKVGYEPKDSFDPKEKRSTITVTDESCDVRVEPGNNSVSSKSAIDQIDEETSDMDVESAKCSKNDILEKDDCGRQGGIPIAENSVKESSETTSDKSFSKVSFRQLNSDTHSVTTDNLDDKGTTGASFGEDFEDDLRAMEESMWLDDIDKSKNEIPSKICAVEKSSSDAAHHNKAEPREERLNRKRSSEIEGTSETPKRSKLSTSGEEDSDLSSETSRDCDSVLKRPSEIALDRQAKKVRTVEEGKEKSVYQSNLDRIIDEVATGVISNEHDFAELQGDGSADSGEVESAKNTENNSEPKEVIPMPFMRKLDSAELKNLSKNGMEELVIQKVCEAITERCDVGDLRQRNQLLEQMVEQWRKKAQLLSKQVRDMDMVMKRYNNDQKLKKGTFPVKVTRSVGLQVNVGLTTGPIGFSKTKPATVPEPSNRPQVRRKPERSVPSPALPPTNPTAKTSATPTSMPSTPQKTTSPAVSKATTNVSSTNSPATSPVVKQVTTQASAIKTVSTPVKTNVSRPTVVNSSAAPTSVITSTNSPARSGTTTVVSNRVVKSSTTATTPMPIAPKPSQDLIDLTDEEDRVKGNALRNALTVATDALVPTTGSITSVLPSNAITTTVANRGIRVVQPHQLTGNSTTTTAILTPTGTTNTSGHRLAYLVPTAAMPTQQRQVLLASTPQQMRMSVSGRPTIVFKSAQVPSLSQTGMPPGTMVQAGVPTSSSAIIRPNSTLTTLPAQQRPGQLRMPTASMATSVGRMGPTVNTMVTTQSSVAVHPAPLPSLPPYAPTSLNLKLAPPKPELKISKVPTKTTQGIVLSWNMTLSAEHEEVASYQLYAYQEGNAPPSTTLWKKVGDVKALPLPMACTLTQFQEGHKYHFAVRAVDVHMRCGQFSAPGNIMLTRK